MAEYKVTVGTELKRDDFDKFKADVDALNGKQIKLKVDVSGLDDLKNITKTIQRTVGKNSIKYDIDADINVDANATRQQLRKDFDKMKPEVDVSVEYDESDMRKLESRVKKHVSDLNRTVSSMSTKNPLTNQYKEQSRVLERDVAELKVLAEQVDDALADVGDNEKLEASLNKKKQSIARMLQDIDDMFNLYEAKDRDLGLSEALSKEAAETQKAANEMKQSTSEVDKILNNLGGQGNISFDSIDASISRLNLKIRQLGDSGHELSSMNDELATLRVAFERAINSGNPDEIVSTWSALQRQMTKVGDAARKAESDMKFDQASKSLEHMRENTIATIKLWRQAHSAAEGMFGKDMDSYLERASIASTVPELRNINAEFGTMTKQAKIAGVAQMNVWDRLKNKVREYSSYLTVAGALGEVVFLGQDMARNVLEVDTAMTGLYRVTDLTSSQYDQLYDNMIASAKEYGVTLTDIINATADWTRAGFDADTSNALAEVTTMYQHIADLDYDTAVENLLTAYNGFKDSLSGQFGDDTVGAVSYITDVLNELDNKYSVTAGGLGEALQRSASAMQLAGNTFQETAAMTTGMTEVIQDPEKSGQALKILSLRLRGMKGELQEMGEEVDPTVENISKMQGQILNLTHGKVDIFDDGEFKSTYEIMDGIHSAWKDMSDVEQADLLETIAGDAICRYAQKCA